MPQKTKLRRAHDVAPGAPHSARSIDRAPQVMEQLNLLGIAEEMIGSQEAGGISPENRKKVRVIPSAARR
jgi:hypothetical protein